jgi:hypothetical protein
VASLCDQGIVLAADRRVAVGHGPNAQVHSLRKLFPLGPAAAVATSGAAVGVAVSRTLSRLVSGRAALPTSELTTYALSVFQGEYQEFQEQGRAWFSSHPEAHRLSYVLIGSRDRDGTLSLSFHASEAHGEPYRQLPIGAILTVPRRLGLEGRLGRTLAGGASLDQLRDVALEGLRLIAGKEEAVAGPFDVALVDAVGVRLETAEG